MDLYKDILMGALSKHRVEVTFPDLRIDAAQIVEGTCYRALEKIKAVIEDDSLEDAECFNRIEAIVHALEDIGSNGGSRHDF